MLNLKDKLVAAGLVKKDHIPGETNEQRSRRLSKELQEKRLKVKALVQPAALETKLGEHTFFFTTRSRKMRRLCIEDEIRAGLEKGDLAVVEYPDKPDFPWAVVPRQTAEKVLKADRNAVRFYVRSKGEVIGASAESCPAEEENDSERP